MIRKKPPLSFLRLQAAGLVLFLLGMCASPAFSASSIQLTWDANPESDLMGYYVHMGTAQGSYHTTENAGINPSYVFQNLQQGLTYYFTVTAYDQSGNISEPAQEVAIDLPTQGGDGSPPDTTAPSIPSGLQATSLSTTKIRLNWTPSTDNVGVTSYSITRNGSNVTSVATTSFTDKALSPGTTYIYKVTAHDAAGNGSTSSAPVSATTKTPLDTMPPTITLVVPQHPSPLSGTITLSATATDNIGIVGVQFHLGGANLGPEDTTNDYAVSWDTTTVPDGSYTLTATARDAAGNTTTATPVTVTVSNPTSLALTISNLNTTSGKSYVVPTSGLQAGDTVYIDRAYTFTTVPAGMEGATYIQTANDDKAATNAVFLSFTVNQPVSVYVAHDIRITPKPSWLNTFTDTGKDLVTSVDTLHLFVRPFPAGTITLGGNASSSNPGSELSMYSVIVQEHGTNVGPPNNHDLNGDRKGDLIWRNTKTSEVAVWLLNGTTLASSGSLGQLPAEWALRGVGDLNGDGKTDIVWRNGTSGAVAVWLMNGKAMTSAGFPGTASTAWDIHGVGDVNGDGKADLIWRHTNGHAAVWLMDGTVLASTGALGGVSLTWQIAGVGDLNGDRKADIIWRHSTSGAVAVWLMNGVTRTSVGFPATASTAWNIHKIGDVNGDGMADLIWRHTNGHTGIWLMSGTEVASTGSLGAVSLAWQIGQVSDVDADGNADLIWRHGTNGAVSVWLMNGATMISSGFPGTASTDWEIQ
ncbi:MAG TPA: FG-GAP-like repeat-containing protein [Nitrospirales bacterium]|nr:hypothetical protein [Nitrospiraceae bacterium]HNP27925.1 FG-GAP-like repeat-containing protein [Nitrospirales bacterium]